MTATSGCRNTNTIGFQELLCTPALSVSGRLNLPQIARIGQPLHLLIPEVDFLLDLLLLRQGLPQNRVVVGGLWRPTRHATLTQLTVVQRWVIAI